MICLADNDVVFKLAACDLLDRALDVLGLSREHVFVLNTTKYQLQKKRSRERLEAKYGVDGIARALEFVLSVNEIDSQQNADDLAALSIVENIDSGEAVIFATAKRLSDSILLMGDKRSLRALSSADSCINICDCLKARVICFEQILRLICAADFDGAKHTIIAALECDTMLRIVFSRTLNATLDGVNEGLDSYISDLRNDTGELLIF